MKYEVKLYVGGKVFTETVHAVNNEDAKETALARNPKATVIGVNPTFLQECEWKCNRFFMSLKPVDWERKETIDFSMKWNITDRLGLQNETLEMNSTKAITNLVP